MFIKKSKTERYTYRPKIQAKLLSMVNVKR